MKTITVNGEQMTVELSNYMVMNNTMLRVNCADGSPYAHVSTNLIYNFLDEDECFILDTYEDKLLPVPELVEAGIITPTERTEQSGFNTYRLYKVNVS